jgi:hypothetical protein
MLFLFNSREGRDIREFLGSGVGCIILIVLFLAFISLLSAIAKALSRVHPDNRVIEPAQVWLNIIPVINLIWMPVTVDRVGESFRNELLSRGRTKKQEGYAKSAGFIALFLMWAGNLLPVIGVVFWFFGLIFAGVYWMLVNTYAKRLKEAESDVDSPAAMDEGW